MGSSCSSICIWCVIYSYPLRLRSFEFAKTRQIDTKIPHFVYRRDGILHIGYMRRLGKPILALALLLAVMVLYAGSAIPAYAQAGAREGQSPQDCESDTSSAAEDTAATAAAIQTEKPQVESEAEPEPDE